MNRLYTKEKFLECVKDHEMKIIRDDGIYRHIRFKKPKNINQYFDLITWPGCLCYTGDMGTYVFNRLEDMFEFFRQPDEQGISFGYWAEKCIARDRDEIRVYNSELAKERINEWFKDQGCDVIPTEVSEEIASEVLYHIDDERALRDAIDDFKYEDDKGEIWEFTDFWETNLDVYTVYFLWCCYALQWGIQKYDTKSQEVGK